MSTNRDLLKEAIADAKAVKETAIANAKAALEEAFTPQIKSMLAAQILAEDEEEDDLAEADKVRMEKDEMEEGYGMDDTNEAEEIDEEFNLEEILAELELEEGDEDYLREKENEPLEEEINLDELDEDELKALIEDVIEDMIESGELEAGGDPVEFSDEEEEEEEEGDEEVDVEMGAEEEIEESLKDVISKIKVSLGNEGELVKVWLTTQDPKLVAAAANDDEGAYKKLVDGLRAKYSKDYDGSGMAKLFNALSKIVKGKELDTFISKDPSGLQGPSTPQKEAFKLQEALKTIKSLQKELNEVNLLNSKLLYVNKIFRNKNLTESQKVKVLSAFDKATSVKESKIIYETLNEGLVSKTTTTKSSIRESLGMASKPAGVAPKQPIVESDQMVKRFQKLAGIL
jgi:hypothetical protein